MPVQGQYCEIQRRVRYAWVWLKDGKDAQECCDDEQGLAPQSRGEPTNIAGKMKPEDSEEKCTEGVEHFDEEVPPQANVGGQVGDQ